MVWRLTRLLNVCNVLKHRKTLSNGLELLRFGCGYFILKFSTVLKEIYRYSTQSLASDTFYFTVHIILEERVWDHVNGLHLIYWSDMMPGISSKLNGYKNSHLLPTIDRFVIKYLHFWNWQNLSFNQLAFGESCVFSYFMTVLY